MLHHPQGNQWEINESLQTPAVQSVVVFHLNTFLKSYLLWNKNLFVQPYQERSPLHSTAYVDNITKTSDADKTSRWGFSGCVFAYAYPSMTTETARVRHTIEEKLLLQGLSGSCRETASLQPVCLKDAGVLLRPHNSHLWGGKILKYHP